MVMLCILAEKNKEFIAYTNEIKKNLQEYNLIKNPFIGFVKTFYIDDETLTIIKMQPIYFNFPIYLLACGIGTALVFGFHWYSLILILFGSLSIFWSPIFFKTMFNIGTKKINPKPDYNFITVKEAMEILLRS